MNLQKNHQLKISKIEICYDIYFVSKCQYKFSNIGIVRITK
jgi:hypothetical protein